jgi:predicted protein tyrosine phosphatase
VVERVVAVLGYSGRNTSKLHPICAGRLAHAQDLAGDGETVILSGWARHPAGTSEADLMRDAWSAPEVVLVSDRTAGTTAGNAANVAAAAEALGASELIVVTSRWHRRRAEILFRSALRGRPVRLRVVGAPGPSPPAVLARELVCLAFVPFQVVRVRRATARSDILRAASPSGHTRAIDEELITRDEVVALLFNVSDIATSVSNIEELLKEDHGEEEADEG